MLVFYLTPLLLGLGLGQPLLNTSADMLTMDKGLVKVDNNLVVVLGAPRSDQQTCVTLLVPNDAWVKELDVSGGLTFGVKIKAGDQAGEVPRMDPAVANWKFLKYAHEGIGTLSTGEYLYIRFLKPKTFGILTDYGTLLVPANQVIGKNVFLFWPNDVAGDAWQDFVNDLDQIAGVTKKIASIGSDILTVVKNAIELAEAVGLTEGDDVIV